MRFMRPANADVSKHQSPFLTSLSKHFGADARKLPVVSQQFEIAEHVNVQFAIDTHLSEAGRTHSLVGVNDSQSFHGATFAEMLSPHHAGEGPVEYVNLAAGEDQLKACVKLGLYLISDRDHASAVLLRGANDRAYFRRLTVDVMAPKKEDAEDLLRAVRRNMRTSNVYRGHVISLVLDDAHNLQVEFHSLPKVEREAIILPDGLLDRIERQTIGFGHLAEKLRAAGRHLKRGLLLHGAPGTGKTLTAMYLAGRMEERTVLLLTGRGLGLIEVSCRMARALQPSTVILEDVDLVAEERTHLGQSINALLFELLNEMDGLAEDADILFLLTCNRPEILEPALAARPGRIDQAVEIPLPDSASRRRLFELYSQKLNLQLSDLERFVRRTEGVSAAFIRELLRRAALIAADDDDAEIVVRDRHMDEALHELFVAGGPLTRSLLGARGTES
jgi:hypothetical protein